MIFPPSARSWTAAWRELIDAAPVRVHNGASRSARAQIQRVWHSISVCVGLTQERKRRVKGAGADDVSTDAEPVWGEIVIPYPALQISGCGDCLGRGQPQKIT